MKQSDTILMIDSKELKKELKAVVKEVFEEKTNLDFSVKWFSVSKAAEIMNMKYNTLRTKIEKGLVNTTDDGNITGAEILRLANTTNEC